MIDHLPSYQSPDGRIVQAGRIKEVVGPQVKVSSAPVSEMASLSTGYPLVPIPVDERFHRLQKPTPGKVLIIDATGLEVTEALAFEVAYSPHGEVKPPLRDHE